MKDQRVLHHPPSPAFHDPQPKHTKSIEILSNFIL